MERRLAAIFAADVAGYSRLIGADEEGTLMRLTSHRRELIEPKIAEHHGRLVKTTGDGVLAEFASPVKAVRCAIDVQHGMAARNADIPEGKRIEFRIGINLGDVVVEDGDIFGDGVNVAARLENIAEPGAVFISRAVRDFVTDAAGFVLEGSIRKSGNRVRITAQLIDAESGGHLWADRFDRDLTDIFATQDEVVEKIVRALAVTLTHGEEKRLGRRGTANVAAYEASLRARELLSRSTREGIAQARAMYHRAIELDPTYAVPHAGLAATGVSNYVSDWTDDPEAELGQSERWARRALELDDAEPFAHMALGSVMLWRRDHDGALAEFHRMIELDPNFAQGYSATGLALMYAGRAAEALEPFALAMRLDPHYPSIVLHFVAQANFSLGNYGTAAKQLMERISRTPGTDSSRMMLAACYGHLGRTEDARTAWAELLKVNPDFSLEQRARVLPYKDPRDFARIAEGLAKAGLP